MENSKINLSIEELDMMVRKNRDEKNYNECLKNIEKCIILKSEKYGNESPEFLSSAKDLCEICNLAALYELENNRKEEGLNYLLKAGKLSKNYKELLNMCYNNIGCYYKFLGQYSLSLHYLESALKIAHDLNNKKKAAEAHLNTSTLLAHVGKYNLAAEMCLASLILLQNYMTENAEKQNDKETSENLVLLILSYQNLAVQHENMNNPTESLLFFQISRDLYSTYREKFQLNIGDMIDEFYKLKLVSKISKEKCESGDKTGIYFNKKYLKVLKKGLEKSISIVGNIISDNNNLNENDFSEVSKVEKSKEINENSAEHTKQNEN